MEPGSKPKINDKTVAIYFVDRHPLACLHYSQDLEKHSSWAGVLSTHN